MEITLDVMIKGARTTFWLSLGFVVASLISAGAMIIIARLLGTANYGLYSAVFFIVAIIQMIETFGMGVTLIRYVARTKDKSERARYVKAVTVFEGVMALCLAAFLIFFSDFIANFLQKAELSLLLKIASLMILATAMQVVGSNYFIGISRAKVVAFFLIIMSVLRNGLAIVLVLLGYGVLGAISGQAVGIFSASLVLFLVTLINARPSGAIGDVLKEMIIFATPFAVSSIMLTLSSQIYNLLATWVLTKSELGVFSAAVMTFLVILGVINMIVSGFLPSFSQISIDEIRASFGKWVKYIGYVIGFMFSVMFAAGRFIIPLVFGEAFLMGGVYFVCFSFVLISAMLGLQVVISIILGIGRTKYIALMWIPSIIIGLVSSLMLLEHWYAYAIILGYIITYNLAAVIGLIIIKREVGVSIDMVAFAKILLISIVSGVLGFELAVFSNLIINLIVSTVFSVAGFLGLTLVIRPLSFKEMKEIAGIIRHMPLIGEVSVIIALKIYRIYKRIR